MVHVEPAGENLSAAAIVAHPDDEILWAGGFILDRPNWNWSIITLCRGSDPDRAPRFDRVMQAVRATGRMGDMDDGPEQFPLPDSDVQDTITSLLSKKSYDVILTHGPAGEYTRHRRHEEVCQAVTALWREDKLQTSNMHLFAYEDGGRNYLPKRDPNAALVMRLSEPTWRRKYEVITEIYGFAADTFEARTTPREEAFWTFNDPQVCFEWTRKRKPAV